MSDEDKDAKTEEATPRKLEEARADGQVAMSTEFAIVKAISLPISSEPTRMAVRTM